MSKGALLLPSTVTTYPVPVSRCEEKSATWTDCPEGASAPRATVEPEATTVPEALRNCQPSACVDVVTTVARFGPSGR